ncbi:MAG: MBL fold metallo-hydrolase [Candidatus Thorarchaeota archaeon]
MEVQKFGSRGILFNLPSKPFTVQIYCINSPNYLFLIDTGVVLENQMEEIKKYLEENKLLTKPVIIFHTHHHYDHIGNNYLIDSTLIIGHHMSLKKFQDSVDLLKKYDAYKEEAEKILFPNMTFSDRLIFVDEGVEFFYTPGHTEDSASCYDNIDKILIIGDSVVRPLASINWHNLDRFIQTLEDYKKIEFSKVILGHEKTSEDKHFFDETIAYIKNFKEMNVDTSGFTEDHALLYRWGLINIARDFKKHGLNEEAKKFLLKAKTTINNPAIKPKDDGEFKQIKDLIEEELKEI